MVPGTTIRFAIILLLAFAMPNTYGQTLEVTATQPLSFGNFTNSGGGSVTIHHNDAGSTTGTVMLVGIDHQAAVFNLTITAERTVNIFYPPGQILTREGGTETMAVTVGPADRGASFTALPLPFENSVQIGGTLTVGTPATNPSGSYSGEIEVEFTIVYE